MAFVVRRPRGRWEIRESIQTPAGPRARTLASFSELSEPILDRCRASARTPFDRDAVVRSARKAGVPFEKAPEDAAAEELLRHLARGRPPRPGLRRLLAESIDVAPQNADPLVQWIGASLQERGAVLVDLLDFTDQVRPPKPRALGSPGLSRDRLER